MLRGGDPRSWGRAAQVLAAYLAVLVAGHMLWLARFRASAPPEYDEAGYIAIALRDLHGWQRDGLTGLWRAYADQVPEAPLVPLAGVVPMLVGGAGVTAVLAVQLVSLVLVGVFTYRLACRWRPGWPAALAAVVATAVPAMADFTRTFHFAVPAAACMTGAALAMVASRGFTRRGPAVWCGVLVGLMLLSRTMTVAYLPGLAVAALAVALRPANAPRRARLVNLGVAAMAAVMVAATWYARAWHAVRDYLLDAGYGADASSYGHALAPTDPAYWLYQLAVVANDLQLPLAVAVAACLLVGGAAWLHSRGVRAGVRTLWRTDAVVPVALVAEGYMALTSSHNVGTGFTLAWVPCLAVLAVVAAGHVRTRAASRGLSAALVAAVAFALMVKSDALPVVSGTRTVQLGGLPSVAVYDGDWLQRADMAGDGYAVPPAHRPLPAPHHRWTAFFTEIGDRLASPRGGTPTRVLVISDAGPLTTTRVSLGLQLSAGAYAEVMRAPAEGDEAAYREFIVARRPGAAVTAALVPGRDTSAQRALEAALAAEGFAVHDALRAPDGRPVRLWTPRAPTP